MRFKISEAMLLAIAVGCSLLSPAQGSERKLFENVRGWEVERDTSQQGPHSCLMSYSYRDKDDNNAENAIIVRRGEGQMVLVLGYEQWSWDKDEKVVAAFGVDKKVLYRKQGWTGDGKLLTSGLPDSAIMKLSEGKEIVLTFDDDSTADFRIAGFGDAMKSLNRCDSEAQSTAASVNPRRAQVYMMGLVLQNAVANCEVTTTGKQRAALDAKVAALRPEMAPIESVIQGQMHSDPSFLSCPSKDEDKASFNIELDSYITLSPEDYAGAADRREAERKSSAGNGLAPKL